MVDVEEIEIGNQVREWDYICAEFERIGGRSSQIVVSSLLIQLWDIITRVIGGTAVGLEENGIWIHGPMGTGKSQALLYIMHKLRTSSSCVVLLMSPNSSSLYSTYLKSFCRDRGISIESDSSDTYKILRTILHSYDRSKSSPKLFLLVELGKLRQYTPGDLKAALIFLKLASSYGWYVVTAASSGAGRQLGDSRVSDIALYLKGHLKGVESQNFTEREAIKFICLLCAAEQGKEEDTWQNYLSKATNGNPLLLRFYKCARTDGYDKGYRLVQDQLLKIVDDLLTSMPRKLYLQFIENSFTWLTYAIEERHIPKSEEDNYSLSYVAREYLTCKEDKDGGYFTLRIVFPDFYETFVKQCSQLFKTSSNDDMIKRCPSVQGLIFEHEFLTHTWLHTLTVSAINEEEINPRTFSFCINPAYCQMQDALSSLSPSCLHYLRPGHRAIDAVCLTAETESGENYLLLIQVSLSSYANHKSKALDIHAKVVSLENEVCKNDDVKSIGEYYRTLPGVEVESKNVMFVYASPKEIRLPTTEDFISELCQPRSRSERTLPAYWYGFIVQQSHAADILNKIYTFII